MPGSLIHHFHARREFASGGVGGAQAVVGDPASGTVQHQARASSRGLDPSAANGQLHLKLARSPGPLHHQKILPHPVHTHAVLFG